MLGAHTDWWCLPSLHSWFWSSFWKTYISIFLTWYSFPRDAKPDICKTFLTKHISKSFFPFYWTLAQLPKFPCRLVWLIMDAWMKDCKKLQQCPVLVINTEEPSASAEKKARSDKSLISAFLKDSSSHAISMASAFRFKLTLEQDKWNYLPCWQHNVHTTHICYQNCDVPLFLKQLSKLITASAISLVQDSFHIQKDEAQ